MLESFLRIGLALSRPLSCTSCAALRHGACPRPRARCAPQVIAACKLRKAHVPHLAKSYDMRNAFGTGNTR
eukprot:9493339-Pyramimonas_sp.AAC.1